MMYAGIYDMPIGRWWDANDNDDPIHLVRFELFRFLYRSVFKLRILKRWKEIQYQHFEKIALDRKLEAYLLELVKLESIRVDIMLHEGTPHGRYLKTMYEIKSREIKAMENTNEVKRDNFKEKAILSKYVGFRIDENKESIAAYHGYINDMKDEYQRMKSVKS